MKTLIDYTSDKYFWTVCSSAFKHMWQKNGGQMIPNAFLEKYIGDQQKQKN